MGKPMKQKLEAMLGRKVQIRTAYPIFDKQTTIEINVAGKLERFVDDDGYTHYSAVIAEDPVFGSIRITFKESGIHSIKSDYPEHICLKN